MNGASLKLVPGEHKGGPKPRRGGMAEGTWQHARLGEIRGRLLEDSGTWRSWTSSWPPCLEPAARRGLKHFAPLDRRWPLVSELDLDSGRERASAPNGGSAHGSLHPCAGRSSPESARPVALDGAQAVPLEDCPSERQLSAGAQAARPPSTGTPSVRPLSTGTQSVRPTEQPAQPQGDESADLPPLGAAPS
ncbi:unnamed protein product [Prorocentrum cordatum]|uniref:Uncharacterized protein n=1 Tax=Prorocentrum cordatum TaxID=2364126 RepID=A0ABN9VD40_9DINO|nr:unnamed protein product [Polarella glacialis]